MAANSSQSSKWHGKGEKHKKKRCPKEHLFFCWGTRTRTRKGRTRICSVTITPYPKLDICFSALTELRVQRYYFFSNRQNFFELFYKNSQKNHFSCQQIE